MKLSQVERHIIKKNNPLYKALVPLCELSNNLANETIYAIRQHYFYVTGQQYTDEVLISIKNKFLNYKQLCNYFTNIHKSDNYRALSANCGQCTIKEIIQECESFFALLEGKKNGTYDKNVSFPSYKKKGGLFVVTYNRHELSMYDGKIFIPKHRDIVLDFEIKHYDDFSQMRIVPKNDSLVIEFIYKIELMDLLPYNKRVMGIDLGVDNFATCVSNVANAFIIDGRQIKAVNAYYNKFISKTQAELDKTVNKDLIKKIAEIDNDSSLSDKQKKQKKHPYQVKLQRSTKQLRFEIYYRNNVIMDFLHKASSYVVNHAVKNKISAIYIGRNIGWKQEANMGRVNNQKFCYIPHSKFIEMLKYKAKMKGISVFDNEESYTSKASFLDNDVIPVFSTDEHEPYKFSGKRKYRGLYKSKDGILLNADVNGAFNILRKGLNVNAEALLPSVKGFVFNPTRVKVTNICKCKKPRSKVIKK